MCVQAFDSVICPTQNVFVELIVSFPGSVVVKGAAEGSYMCRIDFDSNTSNACFLGNWAAKADAFVIFLIRAVRTWVGDPNNTVVRNRALSPDNNGRKQIVFPRGLFQLFCEGWVNSADHRVSIVVFFESVKIFIFYVFYEKALGDNLKLSSGINSSYPLRPALGITSSYPLSPLP